MLNSQVGHPVIHLILGEPLLPSEFIALYLCEPLQFHMAGELISPWVVLGKDLGRYGGWRVHTLWNFHLLPLHRLLGVY